MINRVIVLNNPLKYTDPSGHGFFSRVWRNIRRAVSNAVKSVERKARHSVKNIIKQVTTFSLQSIVNVAIDAALYYYDIDPDGRLGLTIKAVANQAVRYATDGAIDGLYKAESSGGSGGGAISASSSGGARENIGNGLAYLASPGYGLYRDYNKWRETHSVEEHGTLSQMIGKNLYFDRLFLLLGSGAKRIDDFKKGKRKGSNRARGKEQFDAVAEELNIRGDLKYEFSDFIHERKHGIRGPDVNYTYSQLRRKGKEFLELYGNK